MIELTRFNGMKYYLNPHIIEYIDANPDTTITLVSEKKILVLESVGEIINKIIHYRKQIGISISDSEAELIQSMEGNKK